MKINITPFKFSDNGYPDEHKMSVSYVSQNIVEVSNLTPEVKHMARVQREVQVEIANAMFSGYILREKENSIVVKLYWVFLLTSAKYFTIGNIKISNLFCWIRGLTKLFFCAIIKTER